MAYVGDGVDYKSGENPLSNIDLGNTNHNNNTSFYFSIGLIQLNLLCVTISDK